MLNSSNFVTSRLSKKHLFLLPIFLTSIFLFCILSRRSGSEKITDIYSESRRPGYLHLRKQPLNQEASNFSISIVAVLEANSNPAWYRIALDSIRCYASAQGYQFRLINESDYLTQCKQPDHLFRRHCVVAQELSNSDFTLFIDADIGVVNPRRRIEEFIDLRYDLTFYERFYIWELAAGSYLAKNSEYSKRFLIDFANYGHRLPGSFHGLDNGIFHLALGEKLLEERQTEMESCRYIYYNSQSFDDLFAFENCVRSLLGYGEDHGRIRIMKKGSAWVRDGWLIQSKWQWNRDFMLHGWKSHQLVQEMKKGETSSWINPFAGEFDLKLCARGNTTWNMAKQLIISEQEYDQALGSKYKQVELKRMRSFRHLTRFFGT